MQRFVGHASGTGPRRLTMLYWSALFLMFAFVAGLLGFTGIGGTELDLARWAFVLFLLLFVITLAKQLLRNLR